MTPGKKRQEGSMSDDNGEGLRALFYGLCSYWGISIRAVEDPSDPSDFTLPVAGGRLIYVVIIPEPADRQVEIATLLHYGNRVLVLDGDDLEALRCCAGATRAGFIFEDWMQAGTHAACERQRMGIASRGQR